MKKLFKLFVGLAAVCALTACGGGKGSEVSSAEFKKQAAAVEEHEYTGATVSYNGSVEMSMPDFEKLMTGTVEMKTEKEELKGEIKFEKKNGEWTTDSTDVALDDYFELANVKDLVANSNFEASLNEMGSSHGVKSNTKFMTGPLGIEISAKGEVNENGAKGNVDVYYYMSFDNYGYITREEIKMNTTSKVSSSSASYESVMKVDLTVTVSYQ